MATLWWSATVEKHAKWDGRIIWVGYPALQLRGLPTFDIQTGFDHLFSSLSCSSVVTSPTFQTGAHSRRTYRWTTAERAQWLPGVCVAAGCDGGQWCSSTSSLRIRFSAGNIVTVTGLAFGHTRRVDRPQCRTSFFGIVLDKWRDGNSHRPKTLHFFFRSHLTFIIYSFTKKSSAVIIDTLFK